ncbi:MAG: diaminopimelate decarboxylase [Acidobacteria bacterium]|nr:diaminopimelate decarboxylase [Acidobacteriota bacterium]
MGSHFHYQRNQLYCEETPLEAVARQVGTPCYVYSRSAIIENFHSFRTTFIEVDPLICYSVKANSNLAVLQILNQEGSGFDVVSAGELYRLEKIGVDPRKVIFSGVGKTVGELEAALEIGIGIINVESLEELELLTHVAVRKRIKPHISFRINPDVDALTHPYIATGLRQHKFGINLEELEDIIRALQSRPQLELTGLSCHIGSQILDVQPFLDAFLKLRELADALRRRGFAMVHLDLGGGIGIPYRSETPPRLTTYAEFLKENQNGYQIIFEPGRFIVGNAGVLLNQVLYNKVSQAKRFIVVDGAMNDLLRPSLYQSYHEILPVKKSEKEGIQADVVGPICESGDFFAKDRVLPQLQAGEYLAVMNAGAYGFVLSSNYNSRPRVAEILVHGSQIHVIRSREGFEDLIRGESLLP